MDEGIWGPMTDYGLVLGVASCQQISCPAYKPPSNQKWLANTSGSSQSIGSQNASSQSSSSQTTCITFKLHASYYPEDEDPGNNEASNRVIRMAEMSDEVYKDFATDSNGDAILTLTVGGSKEYDFWLEENSTPSTEMTDSDPDNDPEWDGCDSSPCNFPTPPYKRFMKSFDQSCSFLQPSIRMQKTVKGALPFVPLQQTQ